MPIKDETITRCVSAAESADRLREIIENLHSEVSRLTEVAPTTQAVFQVAALKDELEGMAVLISETRAEVAGLLPTGMPHTRLAAASDDLDAVVGATEEAAAQIMTAAEQIQGAIEDLRGLSPSDPEFSSKLEVLDNAAMDIFMACSFQDLTGQRIRKVVHALTYIEDRVLSLTRLWQERTEIAANEAIPADKRADAHLLNGPSMAGLSQTDIDSLLSPAEVQAAQQNNIDALFAVHG
ncbi:MAG: protein phosphatase CheZ [Alphaproteobacteria bacterium]|nr:protein phosphatase CheZ [Alphaproteobacteria bacterium]